ncbi:MAG: hypothetical protein ACKO3F_16840 [Cyanobium sp.]
MPEEPCQCPDCQRFYREHDRLIRENPTLRQQQELSWAALQSFRTLAGRVMEELQKQEDLHKQAECTDAPAESSPGIASSASPRTFAAAPGQTASGAGGAAEASAEADGLQQAMADLENINAHLFSIEALMERIFDVRVPEPVEQMFREVAGELAPDPLNADRLRLNRLLHQTPDLPG